MKKQTRSKLTFILSVSIFGTVGVFVKFIPMPSAQIALFRAVLATLLIFFIMPFTGQSISIRKIKKDAPLLVISGIAIAANWILLFESYKYTAVSVASLCNYFAPVIVTAVCPIIFKEKRNTRQTVCCIVSTLGLVLISDVSAATSASSHLTGVLLALGSAVLYALAVILNKRIRNADGISRTFWQFLSAIPLLVPYVLLTGGISLEKMNAWGWVCLLTVGIVHTGISYCLYFSSLKDLSGQTVAVLSYVDPLLSVFLSIVVLNEKMTAVQIVGAFILLGALLFNETWPGTDQKKKHSENKALKGTDKDDEHIDRNHQSV